jgi:hypothetical protein
MARLARLGAWLMVAVLVVVLVATLLVEGAE